MLQCSMHISLSPQIEQNVIEKQFTSENIGSNKNLEVQEKLKNNVFQHICSISKLKFANTSFLSGC